MNLHCTSLLKLLVLVFQLYLTQLSSTQLSNNTTFPGEFSWKLLKVYRFNYDVLVLNVLEQAARWSLHHPEE